MQPSEVAEIVDNITYKPGWRILLRPDKGARYYVQIQVDETAEASTVACGKDRGKRMKWRSGKHYLSKHMCRQEIVGTVFGAIQAAEMHEMREWFRYRGASIYNPHLCPEVLVDVARRRASFDFRRNAMTMEES